MAKINLLPWRQELRRQQLRDFIFFAALFAALGGGGGAVAYLWLSERIRNQESRNSLLTSQIVVLDKKITEIDRLEEKKSALLARMEAIERLQTTRPTIVRLFGELHSTLPEGVSYTRLTQSGSVLTIEGLAESEARVSSFMRRLERSELFNKPTLRYIRVTKPEEGESSRVNEFSLTVRQSTSKSSAEALDGETI